MMSLFEKTMEKLNEEGRRNEQLYKESLKGNQRATKEIQEKGANALATFLLYVFATILIIGFVGAIILMVLVSF
ncbi:unnamed protein product [marine sediment metagenome]|uniref:Uncharacterized protein n=1 Tax=marine sediment metagenome TaxID=412755 RepID=X1VA60_9ZZZZ